MKPWVMANSWAFGLNLISSQNPANVKKESAGRVVIAKCRLDGSGAYQATPVTSGGVVNEIDFRVILFPQVKR
jgi:hypothetical protein